MTGLLACVEAWTPAEWNELDAVAAPEVLATGLDTPAGIAADNGAFVVAEYGGGRVLRISESGTEELAAGLEGPWGVAVDGSRVLVSERDGGRVVALEDGDVTTLADRLATPGRVAAEDGLVAWLDEGTGADGSLWLDGQATVTALASPLGLALADGVAWVCERGTGRLLAVDGDLTTVAAEVGEAPQDVAVSDGAAWFTAYTYDWPRGAWIYLADDDGMAATLTYPSWIAAAPDALVWAGGGVIATGSRDGGTWSTLVVETAVGSLLVDGGDVVWTEAQRGEVRRVALE